MTLQLDVWRIPWFLAWSSISLSLPSIISPRSSNWSNSRFYPWLIILQVLEVLTFVLLSFPKFLIKRLMKLRPAIDFIGFLASFSALNCSVMSLAYSNLIEEKNDLSLLFFVSAVSPILDFRHSSKQLRQDFDSPILLLLGQNLLD